MRIAVLPIDSRPCNTQFIDRMVTWAGGECVLPYAYAMDEFRSPAKYSESKKFIEKQLSTCDALVLSLDHWCFGSLLASREEYVTLKEALDRVAELKNILSEYPKVPVYMSSVVLRSSVSTLSKNDLKVYNAFTDYSFYKNRFECFSLNEDLEKAKNAKVHIPPYILEKVIRLRKRNLQVNLAAIDMASSGLVDSLSILQEDSQIYGFHKKDQQVIISKIIETGARNIYFRNGADEAGSLHAAKAMWKKRPNLKVNIIYLGNADFTAAYEDRPFHKNMESACREIGILNDKDSDIVICVCCPENGDQEESSAVSDDYLRKSAHFIDNLICKDKKVYLLDILQVNGGNVNFISKIKQAGCLSGYSAWNTASNSMGTLLAQVMTDAIRGSNNKRYFMERILDDLIYQGKIRSILQNKLSSAGEDVYALKNYKQAEKMLNNLYKEEMPALWPFNNMPNYKISLPWRRTFEIKAEIQSMGETAQ